MTESDILQHRNLCKTDPVILDVGYMGKINFKFERQRIKERSRKACAHLSEIDIPIVQTIKSPCQLPIGINCTAVQKDISVKLKVDFFKSPSDMEAVFPVKMIPCDRRRQALFRRFNGIFSLEITFPLIWGTGIEISREGGSK